MLRIKDILLAFPAEFTGDENTEIIQPVSVNHDLKSNEITWCSDKNISLLMEVKQGTVITGKSFIKDASFSFNLIRTENPRAYFSKVLKEFFEDRIQPEISGSAAISTSAKLGKNIFIGHNVVIEDFVQIGDHSIINHNTVIHKNTIIHNHVKIGCNCTIGGTGFGYERNEKGYLEVIPHLGNVLIEDHVEIGNNTCIDRAVMGSTILRKHVKIDNLVHIAHGVEIDENSMIIANAMIGGSTKIGKNVWVAPSSSLINKITIEDNSLIGMGAVVVKTVLKDEVIVGNPGKPLKKKDS